MTPYDVIYKTITTLLLNDNAFIYPMYNKVTGSLIGLYQLRPMIVKAVVDSNDNYYLKFIIEDGRCFTLPMKM